MMGDPPFEGAVQDTTAEVPEPLAVTAVTVGGVASAVVNDSGLEVALGEVVLLPAVSAEVTL